MVRLRLLSDHGFIHVTLGQALQVFYPEMDLPNGSLHFRVGKSHLWYVCLLG